MRRAELWPDAFARFFTPPPPSPHFLGRSSFRGQTDLNLQVLTLFTLASSEDQLLCRATFQTVTSRPCVLRLPSLLLVTPDRQSCQPVTRPTSILKPIDRRRPALPRCRPSRCSRGRLSCEVRKKELRDSLPSSPQPPLTWSTTYIPPSQ